MGDGNVLQCVGGSAFFLRAGSFRFFRVGWVKSALEKKLLPFSPWPMFASKAALVLSDSTSSFLTANDRTSSCLHR